MARPRNREEATLMDRVALAFLSGVSALLLGGLLWAAVSLLAAQLALNWALSSGWIAGFGAAMALLGFVLLENFVAHWVGASVRGLLRLLHFVAS